MRQTVPHGGADAANDTARRCARTRTRTRTRASLLLLAASSLLLPACAAPRAPAPRSVHAASADSAAGHRAGAAAALPVELEAGAQDAAAPAPGTQAHAEEMAKKLSNPVADLISVPFQFNYDGDIGPADGQQFRLNIQPVVPFSLNSDWNVISRTILPYIEQSNVAGKSGSQSGLGDTTQSFFFSPKKAVDGVVWGVGPAFLLPTANHDLLGSDQWAAGPTGVVLKQTGPWTIGALGNHLWKVEGDDDRRDVNATFLQPFLAYTTKEAWTYTLNSESTYDWTADRWSVPINGLVSKVVKIGGQLVSVGGGLRYWVESPHETGASGWGVRFVFTPLFPR